MEGSAGLDCDKLSPEGFIRREVFCLFVGRLSGINSQMKPRWKGAIKCILRGPRWRNDEPVE